MCQSQFIEMFGKRSTTPVGNYIKDSFPGEWGKEDKEGNGVKVIRTTNFTNSGKLNLSEVVSRSIEERKVQKKQIQKYDTILERSGGTADNPVGRVVLFEEDEQYLCNNFTQVLRFKDIEPRFTFYALFYFYQTNKTAIRSMGSKTTGIQNLNMSKYLEIGIPNANEFEQKQFVSIAEQADKSKFSGLKSQFIEMFGSDKWPQKCLGEVGTIKRGGGFQKSDYVEHGIPCIHYGQIHTQFGPFISSHITEISPDLGAKTKYASKGDLIIAITSEDAEGSCKSTAWLGDYPVAVGGHTAIFNHNMNPLYMSFFFKSALFNYAKMEYVHGTKVVEMRPDDIAKICVPCPPMSLQEQFSAIAEQADKSKFELKKSIEAIDKVIKSLINSI
uniref:restriction endonuclease subunit S n=1 Tax=Candidatus Cryptobacteroides bacterium TaxID=3085639 RepID=UPI00402A10D6